MASRQKVGAYSTKAPVIAQPYHAGVLGISPKVGRIVIYVAAYNREAAQKVMNRLGYLVKYAYDVVPAKTGSADVLLQEGLLKNDGTMLISSGWGENGTVAVVGMRDDGEPYCTLLGHLERRLVFTPVRSEE